MEQATFAAGCFWGVESDFREIKGVTDTAVGYMGGEKDNPTYNEVCTGTTGHAEVCQVKFDPKIVSFNELLEAFWAMHNPTTLNKQGPDHGKQYRSAIFYHNDEQKKTAEESKKKAHERFPEPIVTEIVPAKTFWRAEEHHQRYNEKHGNVCH